MIQAIFNTSRASAAARAGGVGLLALLAAGCQQTPPASVNTVGPTQRRAVPTPVADERLITDEVFASGTIITGLIEGTTPDGLRIIEAEIQKSFSFFEEKREVFCLIFQKG